MTTRSANGAARMVARAPRDQWRSSMEGEVKDIKGRVENIERTQEQHTEMLKENTRLTKEMASGWSGVQKALEQLGDFPEQVARYRTFRNMVWHVGAYLAQNAHSIAKWATPILVLAMLVWGCVYAYTHGGPPPSPF